MFERVTPGLTGEAEIVVLESHTAVHLGSGGVSVLATPEMVRLMEKASVTAVDHLLDEGYRTVGTQLNVRHVSPTPVGMKVRALSTLMSVDGNRLTFEVEAWDEHETIGSGTHKRAIIDVNRFSAYVSSKRSA